MLVKNIPPVPKGFDPDTVQFGVPPSTEICRLFVGGEIPKWQNPIKAKWECNHIFCLPLKLWYPASWYNSNGDLLPDVFEYDINSNEWPENVGPLDEIEGLSYYQRTNKKQPHTGYRLNEVMSWSLVAYRVVKRHTL